MKLTKLSLPILEYLKSYSLKKCTSDLKAALNVALLDFPQGIAYAMIAGLPFNRGIMASIIASTIGPLTASSRFLMLGPTNAIAVMSLATFMTLGFEQEKTIVMMPLFLLLIAGFMLAGSFLKMANLVNYVSRTVVTAYITTAAILIVSKQLKFVVGVDCPASSTVIATLINVVQNAQQPQWTELFLSLATCTVFILMKRYLPKFPPVATTLIIMFTTGQILKYYSISFELLQNASSQLPNAFSITHIPAFSWHEISILAPGAISVAFLSLLESSAIAKSLAARTGDQVDCNQQMTSMGIANIGCAFFSGMPISGSLTRSMLNYKSGATTPMSSMFSGAILTLLYFFLINSIGQIPRSALATLIIWIGISLINRHDIEIALKTTGADRMVFLLTLFTGMIFTLNMAIAVGVVSSVLLFVQKAANPNMEEYKLGADENSRAENAGVALFHIDGDLFFASSDLFLNQVRNLANHPELQVLILRLRNAHNLDATCVMAIEQLLIFMRERSRHLIISGAHGEVFRILQKSNLLSKIGMENVILEDPNNPTLSTSKAIKRAVELIGREASLTLFLSKEN